MKKILFTTTAIALLSAGLMAQNKKVGAKVIQPASNASNFNRCATPIPSKQWDEQFNKAVEEFKKTLPAGKATSSTYTIPVVFHIIYSTGEAVGSAHNVSQAQVNSQIPILNADYGGTGYNTSLYAGMTMSGHPAFYDYALAAALPAPDNNGVVIAGSGITFCLATKNPSGTTLTEPGIDRHTWQSIAGATDPASSGAIQTLFDGTIKPATIWDVTKYFNVWVSDGGSSQLLGYATFPPSSGLSGMSGTGTTSTDGVWMAYNALGNTGAAVAPYNKGRTLTHESGHWLGLRHIWGDGNCLTDYCNDTPPAAAANYVNCGTAYPYLPNSCAGTAPNGNGPDGDMYMNFMDYSNDCGMWMFTTDQVTRFHTALANSPYRTGLTTSATNLCNVTVSTPTAAFTPPSNICINTPTAFVDGSTGPPTGWNWSVLPSTGVTITTNTVANPSITFVTAGTYTVTDAVSNSSGSNSISHTLTVGSCTVAVTCPDTLTNFKTTDSLTVLRSTTGFVSGNNNYADKEKGEFYSGIGLPANPKVMGAIILYYRNATTNQGTKGTATLSLNMYNGNNIISGGGGPQGLALATSTVSLSTITALTPVMKVPYCGNSGLSFATAIIYPYDFNFSVPVNITGGFILSTTLPPNGTDTAAVFMTSGTTATGSTAWEKQTSGTWYPFNDGLGTSGSTWAKNASLAILPKISCTTGINTPNSIANHIAMFPNPSDGNFNFAVTMPEVTDLTFNVVNTLGQSIFTKTEKGVRNNVINIDLSAQPKGVYYINIVCEKSSVVLKAIVR